MMRKFGTSWCSLSVAALYAAAMLCVAFLSGLHPHEAPTEYSVVAAKAIDASPLCAAGEDAPDPHAQSSCCETCLLSSTPGLMVVAVTFMRLPVEIATRIYFAQRFGHVSDAAPDDLRSRAPPRAA
jgi:hypothetical protein